MHISAEAVISRLYIRTSSITYENTGLNMYGVSYDVGSVNLTGSIYLLNFFLKEKKMC